MRARARSVVPGLARLSRSAIACLGAAVLALLAAPQAGAVAFTCQSVRAYVRVGQTFQEDVDDSCPLPAEAHVTSTGAAADVSTHVSVSGNTITISHDANAPTAEQLDYIFQEAWTQVSFLAPAETLDLAIDFSFFDDPADPTFLPRGVTLVRLTGDGGSTVWVDLCNSEITAIAHQTVLVTGLTPGEELVLNLQQQTNYYKAKPAGNLAQLSITLVPEPGTALLLALGLGALASRRGRTAPAR